MFRNNKQNVLIPEKKKLKIIICLNCNKYPVQIQNTSDTNTQKTCHPSMTQKHHEGKSYTRNSTEGSIVPTFQTHTQRTHKKPIKWSHNR